MKVLLTTLFTFLIGANCFAAAWVQNAGEGQSINTGRYQELDHSKQFEINPYVEYGLNEDNTIGANVGYRNVGAKDNQAESSNVGYGEVFDRKLLTKGSAGVLSAQGTVGSSANDLSAQQNSSSLTSNFDAELRLLWGISTPDYSWGSVFFSTEAAIKSYFQKKGDEWHVDETVGFKFTPHKMILAQLFGTKNFHETLGTQDYDALQFQLSLVLPLTQNWDWQIGAAANIAGRQVEYAPVYLVSFWYNFGLSH